MARAIVKIDHAAIGEIATGGEIRALVAAAAEQIADHVRSEVNPDVPVVVDHYTTDRAAAAVVITDLRGAGLQAKYGVLTRGAATIGVEVTER